MRPRHIPNAGLLNLDDLGAQIAQRPRRHRPGDGLRHLENANTLKRRGNHRRSVYGALPSLLRGEQGRQLTHVFHVFQRFDGLDDLPLAV